MKYTKEQAEMLALLVLMGCAVVVLSFLYLVKPNFAAMTKSKAELTKTEAEIAKLSKARVDRAKGKQEMDTLMSVIGNGEGAIFSGLGADPPLYGVCVQAADNADLKPSPAFGVQTTTDLLEFTEKGTDGKEVTRHYVEVSQTLDVHSADFFSLCGFLSAVEKTSEGLRITHLEMDNQQLDQKEQEEGKVKVKVELGMLGIQEGEPKAIVMGKPEEIEARNPFSPQEGGPVGPKVDELINALKQIRVTGILSDSLIMGVPGGGSVTARKGGTFALNGRTVKYVSGTADTFVFEATDTGKQYRLVTDWRKGQVKTVTEEEGK